MDWFMSGPTASRSCSAPDRWFRARARASTPFASTPRPARWRRSASPRACAIRPISPSTRRGSSSIASTSSRNTRAPPAVRSARSGSTAETGKLTFLNMKASHGTDPCHLIVDKTGRNLLVANFASGSVCVLPIAADGSLKDASERHPASRARASIRGGRPARTPTRSRSTPPTATSSWPSSGSTR